GRARPPALTRPARGTPRAHVTVHGRPPTLPAPCVKNTGAGPAQRLLAEAFFRGLDADFSGVLRLDGRSVPFASWRLASRAAMRSGTAAGSGASGATAISSPAALRSIRSSTRSR